MVTVNCENMLVISEYNKCELIIVWYILQNAIQINACFGQTLYNVPCYRHPV